MDNNTPKNLLDAAKAMHHSQEMQLAAHLFTELSEHESDMIVGGLNPQPLPPGHSIARQPEFRVDILVKGAIIAGHQ